MTPEKHNRYLALVHLVFASVNILVIAGGIVTIFWQGALGFAREEMIIDFIGIAVVSFMYLVCTVPSLVATWALIKRRQWAKTAAIVAAVGATMNFPLGPVVTAYTFWFLFNAPGKALYGKQPQALPSARTNWTRSIRHGESQSRHARLALVL